MTTQSGALDFKPFLKPKASSKLSLEIEPAPTRPTRLGNDSTDEPRAAHEAAEEYRRALQNIEKRKNTFWRYLAMVLDTTSLMLIKHDCVNNKGLGDGHNAWGLLQERSRSNETVTVVSVMRQLARLTLKDDEALPQYFIRAQELSTRLGQAGNTCQSHYSTRWFSTACQNAMSISWCRKISVLLAVLWS